MKINFLLLIIIASLNWSCNNKNTQTNQSPEVDSLVTVSVQQFRAMNMEIGGGTRTKLNNSIVAQGVIEPGPNAKAFITSPVNGFIKSIMVVPSAKVNKGQVLFTIDGPEVMGAQTSLVEFYHHLKMAKATYDRVAQLSYNGIASQKELIQAESEFRILEAKFNSQTILIKKLGLNPDWVLTGKISDDAYITSPINGIVSSIEVSIGEAVAIDKPIAKIIDTSKLLLKFYVFTEQVSAIKPGQKIEIEVPATGRALVGEVFTVGLNANTENKAVECLASIKQHSNVLLVNGMRVLVKVITSYTDGWFLPKSAIHYKEERPFVYILDRIDSLGYKLRIAPVRIGLVQDSLVQVFDSTLTNVLIRGGYELNVEE